MELIKDQHKSPALLRYADRITENRFDSNGGFNLAGGIADARWVFFPCSPFIPFLPYFLLPFLSLKRVLSKWSRLYPVERLKIHSSSTVLPGCGRPSLGAMSPIPRSIVHTPLESYTLSHTSPSNSPLLSSASTQNDLVPHDYSSSSIQHPFSSILGFPPLPSNVPLVNLSSLSAPVISSHFSLSNLSPHFIIPADLAKLYRLASYSYL